MKKVIIVLVCIWVLISVGREVYDFSKIFTQERVWITSSETERRKLLYGSVYDFAAFVDTHVSKNDTVLLLSKDGESYFYSRYYLYPKKVYWIESEDQLKKYSSQYSKLAVYQPQQFNQDVPSRYKKIKSLTLNRKVIGELYTLK